MEASDSNRHSTQVSADDDDDDDDDDIGWDDIKLWKWAILSMLSNIIIALSWFCNEFALKTAVVFYLIMIVWFMHGQ